MGAMSPAPAPQPSALTRFLTGDPAAEPDLDVLRATGLVGQAFTRLPDHARRAELREGFLFTAARHVSVRRELAKLVAAWNEAGIVPLVFKGFHLAEFVYPAPGYRSYADVDLLVGEQDVPLACEAAAAHGWDVAWRIGQPDDLHALHGPEYLGHEAAHLEHAHLDIMVDLHRRIVHNIHNALPPEPVARWLTDAIVAASEPTDWEGARLRVPQPVDAVVFGLALNRCWGSDAWRVKPRDYADMEALTRRHGVTRQAVLERASHLGVARTVSIYLDRCDPARKILDPTAPRLLAVRGWNLAASRERGPIDARRARAAVERLAGDAVELGRSLPVVADTWRRTHRDTSWTPSAQRPLSAPSRATMGSHAWRRLRRAVRRSMRLLRIADGDRDRVAVLATFRILTARGVAVSLRSDAPEAPPDAKPRLTYAGKPLGVRIGGHESGTS